MPQGEDPAGSSPLTPPPVLKLGLRFKRGDARVLRNFANDLRARRPPGVDISLYDKAAESAREGVPLIVECEHRLQVEEIAHGFQTVVGIQVPAIDELNG